MKRLVEFLTLSLKPGARDEFHRLFTEQAYPLQRRWEVDVVDFGPSLHDETTYYVIRAYESLAERQISQDAYYSSTDWREGPREALIGLIERNTYAVLELEDVVIDSLRRARL